MSSPKQEKFVISQVIEQTPFTSLSSQAFLKRWAEINDDIRVEFLSREKWNEEKENGVFRKETDTKSVLLLPEDLQLWEMVGVMEEIDRDTFAEKPERWEAKKKEMLDLAKMFINTGEYLSERLSDIKEGKSLALALSEELTVYGNLLIPTTEEKFEVHALTENELNEVESWIFGEALSSSRLGELRNESEKEGVRKDTLAQFFRMAEKALQLEKHRFLHSSGDKKVWEEKTPIHSAFLHKIENSLIQKTEKPKWEMEGALFRRGEENLLRNLKSPEQRKNISFLEMQIQKIFGQKKADSFGVEMETLTEMLHLENMKKELRKVREERVQEIIVSKEMETALAIQKAVNDFRHNMTTNNPVDLIATRYMNCVGSSTVAGALFSEVGINYLVGSVPEHAFLFLVTSDDKITWFDILNPKGNEELTNDLLNKEPGHKNSTRVEDVVQFAKNPDPKGITFDVEKNIFAKKMPFDVERANNYVTIFPKETGGQLQLLGNTSDYFLRIGKYEEAIDTCRQALTLSPDHPNIYNNMAYALLKLKRYEEAIAEYKKVVKFDPEYSLAYIGIGEALFELSRMDDAEEVLKKALTLTSTNLRPYILLGQIYMKKGDLAEAEKILKKSLEENERSSLPHYYLAELSLKTENNKEAIRYYTDFLLRADIIVDSEKILEAKTALEKLKN